MHIHNLVDGRVPGIILERTDAKLHNRKGAKQYETNIEKEGRHVGFVQFHGMDLKEEESHPEFEAAFHSTYQEVE